MNPRRRRRLNQARRQAKLIRQCCDPHQMRMYKGLTATNVVREYPIELIFSPLFNGRYKTIAILRHWSQ